MNTEWRQNPVDLLDKAPDGRRFVQLPGSDRLVSDFAKDVGVVIGEAELIYRRNGLPFKINPEGDGLIQVDPEAFRTEAERYLIGYRMSRETDRSKSIKFVLTMSGTEASAVLASPFFLDRLRPIDRVNRVRMPVMRASGQVELLPEGYDAEAQVFTTPGGPEVKLMERKNALAELDSLLGEFCFAKDDAGKDSGGRSRSVAISSMLTIYGAGLLPRGALRPAFVFLANAEGAGKSLLVKCAVVPVLGFAPTGYKPKDEDELSKLLLASVMEARQVLFLDNLKGRVSSAALEGFLTAQTWSGRILGKNQSFTGANHTTTFITGNGCTVSPDIRRRSLFCELFLEAERAEDREFKRVLEVPEIIERRDRILSALWSLIVDWDNNGRKGPARGHASFPQWAKIIAGIVESAGYCCPLETPKIEAAADVDGDDMRALIEVMVPKGKTEVTETTRDFGQLVELARSNGLFSRLVPDDGEMDRRDRTSLSALFSRFDRRMVGHCRFTAEGKGHSRIYRARRVA